VTAAEASEEPIISYATSEGPSIDGAATTVFTASVNVKALLQVISDEAVREELATALQAQGQQVTADQLAQLELVVRLFEPTLDATSLTFSQYVTNDNPNFAGFNISFNTTVDPETINALSQGQGATLEEPIVVDFEFDLQLTQVGEALADTVEPVADAQDITSSISGAMGQ
jgi:predicted phage tail protein